MDRKDFCLICWEPCSVAESRTLCSHTYHQTCLVDWIKTKGVQHWRGQCVACDQPAYRSRKVERLYKRGLEARNMSYVSEGALPDKSIPPEFGSGYRRCPTCNIIVHKDNGCNAVQCRCGQHFCYACCKRYDRHTDCPCGVCVTCMRKNCDCSWELRHGYAQYQDSTSSTVILFAIAFACGLFAFVIASAYDKEYCFYMGDHPYRVCGPEENVYVAKQLVLCQQLRDTWRKYETSPAFLDHLNTNGQRISSADTEVDMLRAVSLTRSLAERTEQRAHNCVELHQTIHDMRESSKTRLTYRAALYIVATFFRN